MGPIGPPSQGHLKGCLWVLDLEWPWLRPIFRYMTRKPIGADALAEKVTPAMIEAGIQVLAENWLALSFPECDEYPRIVRTVYEAMMASRPKFARRVHQI